MSVRSKIRKAVKLLTPPVLLLAFRTRAADVVMTAVGVPPMHQGNFSSWTEATALATGYDAANILEIQRQAMRKVRDGEVAYERDSVLFDRIEYFFPALAALLLIASRNGNRLRVLDFGGALGSSYYQNRDLLAHLQLHWQVVEQPHFVITGQAEFQNEHLRFFPTIEAASQEGVPDVVFLSSVLQYLEDPMALLAKISRRAPPFILIDRTPVLDTGSERIVVQNVPARIYPASYACRLFAPDAIEAALAENYDLRYAFEAHTGTVITAGDALARYRGYFFERRSGKGS